MACFWTDLVGSSQTGCGLEVRPAIAGRILTAEVAPTVASTVASVTALYGTPDEFGFRVPWTSAVRGNSLYPNHAESGWLMTNSGFAATTIFVGAGFSASGGLIAPFYDELVSSGTLSVTQFGRVNSYGCQTPGVGIGYEIFAAPAGLYVVSVAAPGVLQIDLTATPSGTLLERTPNDGVSVAFGYEGNLLRLQGSIVGAEGTVANIDCWLVADVNNCI